MLDTDIFLPTQQENDIFIFEEIWSKDPIVEIMISWLDIVDSESYPGLWMRLIKLEIDKISRSQKNNLFHLSFP